MTTLLHLMALMGLFLSINTFAITLGQHTDDLRFSTSIAHVNAVGLSSHYRKVTGQKGSCVHNGGRKAWMSISKATCNTGEIAIAGGIEMVYNESCNCYPKYGFTVYSHQDDADPRTWSLMYLCAKVKAYAICVAEQNL